MDHSSYARHSGLNTSPLQHRSVFFSATLAICLSLGSNGCTARSSIVDAGGGGVQPSSVTVSGDALLTIDPSTVQTVAYGESVSFEVAAAARFKASATVGGTCPAGAWADTVYTTGAITSDCTVMFTAVPLPGLYMTALTAGTGFAFNLDFVWLNPLMDSTYTTFYHSGELASNISFPTAVLDRSGNTYVMDGYQTIYKITPDGTQTVYATSDLFYSALNMRFDAAGNLYVVNGLVSSDMENGGTGAPSNWAVMKVATDGTVSGFIDATDSYGSIAHPYGILFDSDGDFYLSDQGGTTIRKYNADGTGVTVFAEGIAHPGPMVIDPDGFIYVANAIPFSAANGVTKVASDGTTTRYAELGASSARDMAIDPATKTLYVATRGTFFSPQETLVTIATDGTVTTVDATLTATYAHLTALTWFSDP